MRTVKRYPSSYDYMPRSKKRKPMPRIKRLYLKAKRYGWKNIARYVLSLIGGVMLTFAMFAMMLIFPALFH